MFISAINNSWIISGFSWFNPYHDLETRIRKIAESTVSGFLSTQQKADLQQGLKLAHRWTWPAGRMNTLLAMIPKEIFRAFIEELMASGNDKEIEYYLSLCLSILDEQFLLDLSGFKTNEVAITSFQLHGLVRSTALKNRLEKEGRAIWKEFLIEFRYFIHQLLEVLINATGISEAMRQKVHPYNFGLDISTQGAHSKIKLYMELVAFPATVFGFIYSLVRFKMPALLLTFGVVTASLVALMAYNRYWKPCPIDHPGLTNLTVKLLRESKPVYPRQDVLEQIEKVFQSKKGVLFVAPPGTGKTWIVHSFVEQLSAGKICKFMKDSPQVFSENASKFNEMGMGVTFSSIEESFKGHEEKVVFFFDEFHTFFKENKLTGNASAEQLKTFCENFKYIIGATTTEEYEQFIKNQPAIIDRRFKVIRLSPMDNEQMKESLSYCLESADAKMMFDPDVMGEIVSRAKEFNPNTTPVDAAHSLLNAAIEKMKTVLPQEEYLPDLKRKLGVMEQTVIHHTGEDLEEMNEWIEQLQKKREEIKKAEAILAKKKLQIQRIQKMESDFLRLKHQSYTMANPDIDLRQTEDRVRREWITLHARMTIVSERIAKEREALGLPARLDKSLIDRIITERKA